MNFWNAPNRPRNWLTCLIALSMTFCAVVRFSLSSDAEPPLEGPDGEVERGATGGLGTQSHESGSQPGVKLDEDAGLQGMVDAANELDLTLELSLRLRVSSLSGWAPVEEKYL